MTLDPKYRNIVVAGASAGGVEALSSLVANLPSDLPAAVLVVLHIPTHERSFLARVLSRVSSLRVKDAEDGGELHAGEINVAIADHHLMLENDRIRLARGPRECRARPSVNVLFRSAAVSYGSRVVGVVMSGALDDGAAGLWAIKDGGGMALAQDPDEAMHRSMPENAIEHVEVDFVGPSVALAQRIVDLVGSYAPGKSVSSARDALIVENKIAAGDIALEAGVMELGRPSKYACPECHGVLLQVEEGAVPRFRCHTGHAYSLQSLEAGMLESIDEGLSNSLRAVEERLLLLRHMAAIAGETRPVDADTFHSLAAKLESRLASLKQLLADPVLTGLLAK